MYYLRLEISIRALRFLLVEAQGRDFPPWPDERDLRCALCGAREYPYRFPLPHEWPRLYGVASSVTTEIDGIQFVDIGGDEGILHLLASGAKMLGDDIYIFHVCRYHGGRPGTAGWMDYRTACAIEWFPEPSERDLALFNLLNCINYTLWVAMRFLGSLVGLEFIAIRVKVKRSPW